MGREDFRPEVRQLLRPTLAESKPDEPIYSTRAFYIVSFLGGVPAAMAIGGMPTPLEWLNVLALALLSSALAFILYFQLIRNVGPVKTLTVNFLTPLFGVGGGALLLGERIAANMVAGAAVILVGTALVLGATRPRAE